jgi:methylenetetrahydrofolate dehydrogenase (NADP+)/methenyltetrahydrofolate cyclohydrolase
MLLEATPLLESIKQELKLKVQSCARAPNLTALLVGENEASRRYLKHKEKACFEVGIESHLIELKHSTSQDQLEKIIDQLNTDPKVDGILLQLPLPMGLDAMLSIKKIDPLKDVDGLHPLNLGYLVQGNPNGFVPCTPLGIQTLLKSYKISVEKKHVVICGRSTIVGKPLANLLLQKDRFANATVTVAHSQTSNLKEICKEADILVVAIGRPKIITEDYVKKGAIVIDVGISKLDGKLVGDVDFENIKKKASAITPVPGGVGPMTVAMLLKNTLKAYQNREL